MALFGIKRIQYCKATQLAFSGQNNPFLGIASEPTNTFTDVVCMINSRATLTIEQAVVNKQIVYTAKLQFVTPADPMLDVDHYAFIATTNEGERILLGANTRPQVAVVTAQGVFGNAGELTAYTTTAEFKADYRPLRLPVTAAEPISGPAYDICCGQIPQPTTPDTREFDICCGQIIGQEPTPEPTLLTVIWQNYDGSELDRKTYYSNQPEPTTSVTPTRAETPLYTYTFSGWSVYSQTETTKTYRATYTRHDKYVTVAEVEGMASKTYDYSFDGKRAFVDAFAGEEWEILSEYLPNMVVLQIWEVIELTGVNWNEQYLPTNRTWIVHDNIRYGWYVGNNQPADPFKIKWYNNDGTANYTQWWYYYGKNIEPPTTPPTREGYTFIGWATTALGQPVSDYGTMPHTDKEFYAVWEAI